MNASLDQLRAEESERDSAVQEPSSTCGKGPDAGIEISLLEDSLSKSPWERMQANDDALRFADLLRSAMEKRNAESERTDAQTH